MKQPQNQVTNLFQKEQYYLEDGTRVYYQGFNPKEGHIIKFFDNARYEFALPHNTKFYRDYVTIEVGHFNRQYA